MTDELVLQPEVKKTKIILQHPKVVEYIDINCKAIKCTPDEFILKLMNNMMFLSKLHRGERKHD